MNKALHQHPECSTERDTRKKIVATDLISGEQSMVQSMIISDE